MEHIPGMHNPPRPGEVIKELCLDPLGLTVTAAAEGLGVSRRALSALLNGHAGFRLTWQSDCRRRLVFAGKLAAIATAI